MDHWASAGRIAAAVAAGRTTVAAIIKDALARIAERDEALNAFTAVTRERALAKARALDPMLNQLPRGHRDLAEGHSPQRFACTLSPTDARAFCTTRTPLSM